MVNIVCNRVVAPFLCTDLQIQIYSYEVLQVLTELQLQIYSHERFQVSKSYTKLHDYIYMITVTKGFQAMLRLQYMKDFTF